MPAESYVVKQDINGASLRKDVLPLLCWLDMELTERCNNKCIHCCINLPAGDLNAKKRELSTDRIKDILTEAASLGSLGVRFTGGEPLLREDFEEIYIFARKLGLKVLIFTNATLIMLHLAELFSKIPPLEKIEVTVYGMKESSYQAVTRVDGSFESAWRGINLLLDYKIPFVVKGTLLPPNKNEIDELEEWAKSIPWMDKPLTYAMFFDLRSRRDDEIKNKFIRSVRLLPEEGLKVLRRRKEEYFKDMKEFCSKFMRPAGDKIFSCNSGHSGCIDAYGKFQPCMMLRHPDCVYDLQKGSLKDALENFFPGIREMRATNPEYLEKCARCFLRGLCEQCPAKSWMEHGTLDTPVKYLCEIAHAQARYLGLIKDNEKAWEVDNWKERTVAFCEKEARYYGNAS